jgi:hypothetical protein
MIVGTTVYAYQDTLSDEITRTVCYGLDNINGIYH